jgi:hypothetical protein
LGYISDVIDIVTHGEIDCRVYEKVSGYIADVIEIATYDEIVC